MIELFASLIICMMVATAGFVVIIHYELKGVKMAAVICLIISICGFIISNVAHLLLGG